MPPRKELVSADLQMSVSVMPHFTIVCVPATVCLDVSCYLEFYALYISQIFVTVLFYPSSFTMSHHTNILLRFNLNWANY